MAAAAIALAAALACACAWACAEARPARRTTTATDQRQQGELNIRASLENVLILVVPATGAADLLSLAGLKRPGLLQALLKRHKYEAAAGDGGNDVDEEVVATVVEETRPPTEVAPAGPSSSTESPVKEQTTARPTEAANAVDEGGAAKKKGAGEELPEGEGSPSLPAEPEPPEPTGTATAAKEEASHASKGRPEKRKDRSWTFADFVKPAAGREEKALRLRRRPAAAAAVAESTKWAPGLAGLLEPAARGGGGRFAALCAPGRWDAELGTCIMPGDTRSRAELARFLDAMRFRIAMPAHAPAPAPANSAD